jgi:hypothetical protein
MQQTIIREELFIMRDQASREQSFHTLRKALANGRTALVLNFCDGTDVNAYPSIGFPLFVPLTPWSAFRMNTSTVGITETTIYNAWNPVEIVNLAVTKRDYAIASLAYYSTCQMYDAWLIDRSEDWEHKLGFSEDAMMIFNSYRTACMTTLPRIQDYFNHYLEELLDSGNCSHGNKDCDDTYLIVAVEPALCDPWTFLHYFLSAIQSGFQTVPSSYIRLARREMAEVGRDGLSATKCLCCLGMAETRVSLILWEFKKRLFNILRNDEQSIMEFHNWLFDVRS